MTDETSLPTTATVAEVERLWRYDPMLVDGGEPIGDISFDVFDPLFMTQVTDGEWSLDDVAWDTINQHSRADFEDQFGSDQ